MKDIYERDLDTQLQRTINLLIRLEALAGPPRK
jgi:hypothetical protein